MATKLNQVIAIEKGVRNQNTAAVTALYHKLDKRPLFDGMERTYRPKDDEDGDKLPPESQPVQAKADDIIADFTTAVTRLIDITATKDMANSSAKADIVVDGVTLAKDIPVTTLIFLEKQLEDAAAFIGRLPILNPAINWTYDGNRGLHAADPVETIRTKKVPRAQILVEPTKEHPAQVQQYSEDILVGYWTKIDLSSALKADTVAGIQARLTKLREAVKFAREAANMIDVTDVKPGAAILSFLFEGSPQVSG